MLVTDSRPQIQADIATMVASVPITGETRAVADTVDYGDGCIKQRRLQTSNVLVGSSAWPCVTRVFQESATSLLRRPVRCGKK